MVFAVALFVVVGYEVIQIAVWGQTVGKRIVRIKVVRDASGECSGWGKSFGRWAVPTLAMVALALTSGWLAVVRAVLCYVSPTWDRSRQGWHDMAAGTLVIRT